MAVEARDEAARFLRAALLLDLEIPPRGGGPIGVGALLGDRHLRERVAPDRLGAVLDDFVAGREPRVVLGHHVLGHDLPALRRMAPECSVLTLPVVDTLLLSPLAFPENPYHALVKGYKLTKCAVNDPVEDARLAAQVFVDAWRALRQRDAELPGTLGLYRFLFAQATAGGALEDGGGMARLFGVLGGATVDMAGSAATLERIAADRCCPTALAAVFDELPGGSLGELALALAFAAAWLPVAGERSVLPAWLWRAIPAVSDLVHRLREEPCGAACAFCEELHDPHRQLQRYFRYDTFRAKPAAPDGGSLQEQIVRHGMRGGSHLAILPTGGGKSLCFQLPALVRNFCRGSLTIVLSPLQALMRDQVENLNARTHTRSAALYGLLTPLERTQILREIRAGDITILYIAPEQLRNRSFRRAVEQREIGRVFDEAHCLSKWGHDFRPDYLYACRAIQEIATAQGVAVPPIVAMTATARRDVTAEIREHFAQHLGVDLALFAGGVQRDNLRYSVELAEGPEKRHRVREICADFLAGSAGSVIVYHASRRSTEEMAASLEREGLSVGFFHGGLNAAEKKAAMASFLGGETRIICATNAFGMGVDKPDVRLVIHAAIPGTLENYLQEAGRAGRDQQPARCVLLFDEQDVEGQFQLIKRGEVSHRDMAQILRSLRRCGRRGSRSDGAEFQVTAGEILREDDTDTSFGAEDFSAATKVRTAISWLERSGHVLRNLNETSVFTGKPVLANLATVDARLEATPLHPGVRAMWREIYLEVVAADPDQGLTVDDLAGLPAFQAWFDRQEPEQRHGVRLSNMVLQQLQAMTKAGILQAGTHLTAFVRPAGRDVLAAVGAVERAVLHALPAAAPDVECGTWERLSIRLLNEELRREGVECNVDLLRTVLTSFTRDDRRFAGRVYLTMRGRGRDHVAVRLTGTFADLRERVNLRQSVAYVCLQTLLNKSDSGRRSEQLVEFALEELDRKVRADIAVQAGLGGDPLDPLERVLLYLHDHGCLILQNGLAVFRAAMTLHLRPEAKGRPYTKDQYALLRAHYDQRTVQVHVMHRYAKLALDEERGAVEFVQSYFEDSNDLFLGRYFEREKADLERPVGPAVYRRIVDALQNDVQQRIVTAPVDENQLILAGPGSGKTRVIVHRCAFLLRVLRVPRSAVLVLCFNRSTVLELRRRLKALMGSGLAGLQIHTYDSLALRIAGRSLATTDGAAGHEPDDVFLAIRKEATALIEGRTSTGGLEPDELRDRLLRGYQHILVDEYQDIDESQYRLVSAIAGRTQKDDAARLAITAVGDDDQNIYSWRGSSVEFIQRFVTDYRAQSYELVENYRATGALIAAANRWIQANPGRSKVAPIRLDRRRADDPAAAGSPVEVLVVADEHHQAAAVVDALEGLRGTCSGRGWNEVAVLAREWHYLVAVRVLCRERGIPVRWAGEDSVRPWQVRETVWLLETLDTADVLAPADLLGVLQEIVATYGASVWTDYLRQVLELWFEDAGRGPMPGRAVREFFWSVMREERQLAMAETGVLLATAHQGKGLEFERVFVLDGGWRMRKGESQADLRRLFYVAMTRARRELTVLSFAGRLRSFIQISGPEVRLTDATAAVAEQAPRVARAWTQLGLGDLYLSYAGRKQAGHDVHQALRELAVGAQLEFRFEGDWGWLVVPGAQEPVAALSHRAREVWRGRDVLEIRVVAVVVRTRAQSGSEHRDKCRVDAWQVPIVEVLHGV